MRSYHRRDFLQSGAAFGLGCLAAAAGAQEPTGSQLPAAEAPKTPPQGGWRIAIVTDMEGVAGVLDTENWCSPKSRYYELGKELLTREVNAAIEGFARAGATEFLVIDGHGSGGITPTLLDARADLARNWTSQPYPFSLEKGMHFAAWVGQHARSRSENAHLAHTGNFGVFETTINGKPVGEFGELALCAGHLGIRSIFGAGDLAFTLEANELAPGIETVAVKRGTTPGAGDECDAAAYKKRNLGAIHHQPERVRELICIGAERALKKAASDPSFGLVRFAAPYERVTILRPNGGSPKQIARSSHPSDVIALMNAPLSCSPANG